MSRGRLRVEPHDLAAEIFRRTGGVDLGYVVHLSDPPTNRERLLLVAHRLTGKPFAIVPRSASSVEEWLGRYGPMPQ
jgi:hypothetical protein